MDRSSPEAVEVLVVGGGVAGLEALFALQELAGERVHTTLLSPEGEFTLRPMRVTAAFGGPDVNHYPVAELAKAAGANHVQDGLRWLDAPRKVVHTAAARTLSYDALLIAMGARAHPAFSRAVTLDDRRMGAQVRVLLDEIEAGTVNSVAFIAGYPSTWPLPLYELALLISERARSLGRDVAVHLLTTEDAPLALFGVEASRAVDGLLQSAGVMVTCAVHCGVPAPGTVSIHPGPRNLRVDRIVALPQLFGPSAPGVPGGARDGFINVDALCRVRGLSGVYAAGDATNFPVKFGAIAAQQADVAAAAIASLAGAPVEVAALRPTVEAVLVAGRRALLLSGHITGGHGSSSSARELDTWSPENKLVARHLAPHLEQGASQWASA